MKTAAEIADNILQNILIYACNDTAYEGDLNFVSKALTDYAEARVKEAALGWDIGEAQHRIEIRNAALEEAIQIYLKIAGSEFTEKVVNGIRALKHSEATPGAEEKKCVICRCLIGLTGMRRINERS